MKKLTAWATVALCFVLISCASIPTRLPETMKEACALYQSTKPEVLRLRAYARDNWAAIPPNVQETLLKLDGYLPALDRAGIAICAISGAVQVGGESRGTSSRSIDWDDVLSTVVKAATLAADLKTKGVI